MDWILVCFVMQGKSTEARIAPCTGPCSGRGLATSASPVPVASSSSTYAGVRSGPTAVVLRCAATCCGRLWPSLEISALGMRAGPLWHDALLEREF